MGWINWGISVDYFIKFKVFNLRRIIDASTKKNQ